MPTWKRVGSLIVCALLLNRKTILAMTMPNIIQLGIQSFQELGLEFVATVFGSGPTGQTSVVCGVATADSNLQTYFHLNPFDDHECAGSDWVVILILAIIILAISWGTRWWIWEPLANRRMQDHKEWSQAECHRYSQTCTSLLFFLMSTWFATHILPSKDWLFDRHAWTELGTLIDADYKFYYLMYAARFFSELASINFEDRKRDVYIAAVIHHVVTLGLVLGSACSGTIRYGGIIMFFFDWADIPLLSAKICKYLSKDPQDNFQFAANRLFEAFAVLFFVTRNCYYNYVVYCCWMDLPDELASRRAQYLLLPLVGLQTYWLYLVIMAVKRQRQNGGNAEEIREDKIVVETAQNGKKTV